MLHGFAGLAPCDTPGVDIRDNRQLVAALLDVSGVSGASIEAAGSGPGTLRLQLAAGTDQVVVAGEVNRLLRSKFGLAVDPERVRVIDATDSPVLGEPGSHSTTGRHAVADAVVDAAADVALAASEGNALAPRPTRQDRPTSRDGPGRFRRSAPMRATPSASPRS